MRRYIIKIIQYRDTKIALRAVEENADQQWVGMGWLSWILHGHFYDGKIGYSYNFNAAEMPSGSCSFCFASCIWTSQTLSIFDVAVKTCQNHTRYPQDVHQRIAGIYGRSSQQENAINIRFWYIPTCSSIACARITLRRFLGVSDWFFVSDPHWRMEHDVWV